MARKLPPEGKWVHVPVYLREAHVRKLDEAAIAGGFVHKVGEKAGEANRSEWMRALALAALEAGEGRAPEPLSRVEQQAVIDDVMTREPDGSPKRRSRATPARSRKRKAEPEAVATDGALALAPEPEPPVDPEPVRIVSTSSPRPERCPHPGTRVVGGYCKQCGHTVKPGGWWA